MKTIKNRTIAQQKDAGNNIDDGWYCSLSRLTELETKEQKLKQAEKLICRLRAEKKYLVGEKKWQMQKYIELKQSAKSIEDKCCYILMAHRIKLV